MPLKQAFESHHFEALGTNCSVFAVALSPNKLLEAESWVRKTGTQLTRFSARSELSRLNASAGRWVEISDVMESLLRDALTAYRISSGLVNVAVLPSMLAIGYVRPLADGTNVASVSDTRPLPPLPAVLGVRHRQARVERGCGIDLGGVAKGWMADRVCEMFAGNAVANLGGDLRASGPGPSGDGWPVGLAGKTLMLRDQGAATSSVRKRRWGDVHHLIDPRSGRPSQSGLDEVSVVAASGFEAEVLAKTALLLGPEVAPAFCASNALAWWLRKSRDD